MGETDTTRGTAGTSRLADLLAEAAAGLPGADSRLETRLRPELQSLLSQRLAGAEAASVADAGALIQRRWQQLREAGDLADIQVATDGEPPGTIDKKGKAARKASAKAKSRKAVKSAAGVGPTVESSTLYLTYAEQAAFVMQGLVRDLASRAPPDECARTTFAAVQALDALAALDAPLARIARLRWFGGMQPDAIGRLLDLGESEMQRRWVKARAFLAAATSSSPNPAP